MEKRLADDRARSRDDFRLGRLNYGLAPVTIYRRRPCSAHDLVSAFGFATRRLYGAFIFICSRSLHFIRSPFYYCDDELAGFSHAAAVYLWRPRLPRRHLRRSPARQLVAARTQQWPRYVPARAGITATEVAGLDTLLWLLHGLPRLSIGSRGAHVIAVWFQVCATVTRVEIPCMILPCVYSSITIAGRDSQTS